MLAYYDQFVMQYIGWSDIPQKNVYRQSAAKPMQYQAWKNTWLKP